MYIERGPHVHVTAAQQLIYAYISLGAQLNEAKFYPLPVRLTRTLKLISRARRCMPAITKDHLRFMAIATVEPVIKRCMVIPDTSSSKMPLGEIAEFLNTLQRLRNNSISTADPASMAFGLQGEDTLIQLAVESLVRAAKSSGLVDHEDVALVSCCNSISTTEVILRDRRNFNYLVLVFQTERAETDNAFGSFERVTPWLKLLMPVVENPLEGTTRSFERECLGHRRHRGQGSNV